MVLRAAIIKEKEFDSKKFACFKVICE